MRQNLEKHGRVLPISITAAAISAAMLCSCQSVKAQLQLMGDTGAHDPSALTEFGSGSFIYFATGQGIVSRRSNDLTNWVDAPPVFSTPPAWTEAAVPGFTGFFWAPDVSYFDGLYHMYYAVSTFGSQVSAIGMATSPTINPSSFQYDWTDHGAVIQSTTGKDYNAIDPSVLVDTDGSVWMSFGSYVDGIYVAQINPATGMRENSTLTRVADNSSIEASYLYQHDGYYYLFVNFGMCCMGVNSTYNIRVGRSTSITGPYFDEAGNPMVNGGGTLLQGSEGRYIGPGQVGILDDNGQDLMSFHYYDGDNSGTPTLGLEQLYWTGDNWPTLTPVPESAGIFAGLVLPLLLRRLRASTTRI